MISLEELKNKARIKGLGIGNAEKDYLIDLLLFSVSKNTKDELIFKGGTCLYKFYGLGRFSEDADFTAAKSLDVDKLTENIITDMKQFGVKCHIHKKKTPFSSVLITLRCEGPLFNGMPQSYASIRMDINLKSSIDMEPIIRSHSPLYSEIPAFSLLVMQEKEIIAEKIRAILTRNKARDVYDLWALMKKGIDANEIVENKLEYYKMKFQYEEFAKAIERKESGWQKDLKPLVRDLPDFAEVKSLILSEAKKWKFQKKRL